jgi:hypothetical protein
MAEEILKIRAEELTTIRLLQEDGTAHEMPVSKVLRYYNKPEDPGAQAALNQIAEGLEFFSRKGVFPCLEFVIQVKKS